MSYQCMNVSVAASSPTRSISGLMRYSSAPRWYGPVRSIPQTCVPLKAPPGPSVGSPAAHSSKRPPCDHPEVPDSRSSKKTSLVLGAASWKGMPPSSASEAFPRASAEATRKYTVVHGAIPAIGTSWCRRPPGPAAPRPRPGSSPYVTVDEAGSSVSHASRRPPKPRLASRTFEMTGGVQSSTTISRRKVPATPPPASRSTYVTVTVSPAATCSRPGAKPPVSGSAPTNLPEEGDVSFSVTGSGDGSTGEEASTVTWPGTFRSGSASPGSDQRSRRRPGPSASATRPDGGEGGVQSGTCAETSAKRLVPSP